MEEKPVDRPHARKHKKKVTLTFFQTLWRIKSMETGGQSKTNVKKIVLKNVEKPQILRAACQSPRGQKLAVGVATDGNHLILKGDLLP